MFERDIEFLFEVGSLRNMARGWEQFLGMKSASDLEHSFRVALIALILARKEGVKSEEKILKMALIHDLAEARTNDHNATQKVYVTADEDKAAKELFEGTILGDLYSDVLREFEERKTIEAKIVKDADNLDVDVELKEIEERGSQLPAKMAATRKIVREQKLYTQAARDLWDDIQKGDPSKWHLSANKWFKIPDAGK